MALLPFNKYIDEVPSIALLGDNVPFIPYIHTPPSNLDGWDNADWGWKDEDDKKKESVTEGPSLSWLQECPVSFSPCAEILAVANDDRLVLLTLKWDSQEDDVHAKYATAFQGITSEEPGEKITAILCLPLASQKRSSQGNPDWTCVILGFSSGYVRMYTESGTLLLSQIFSEQPVKSIKCRTYEPPRHMGDSEKHEELTILYKKCLVTIDGFSFFQSLRACRNQVARATASKSELLQPPPLAYKKWALLEHDSVADHVACGVSTPNAFDHMKTGSLLGGPSPSLRSAPPAFHLYMTAGSNPFVGFFYASESGTQPMLSDVAHAVASKLKSALFSQISAASGWFGLGGSKVPDSHREKKRPKIEAATSLPPRFGLPDHRRGGESIVLSPDTRLAATTDSFGRVILIDVGRGMAVRMWKGYRDAQVGWVEVCEDLSHDREHPSVQARRALFLIIYAARRGILEVWAAQQGPRVAAFSVSKSCRLLYMHHGMMGLNNVTYPKIKVNIQQLYLLDPDGVIKTIQVPFHLALSDKNSKRARDMHLLKKLKIALKENSSESGSLQAEVIDTLLDIKIASIRQQGLERVLQSKYIAAGFLNAVIQAVTAQLETQATEQEEEEGDKLDYESRVLLQFCKAQGHLLHTYTALQKLNTEPPSPANIQQSEQMLTRVLSLESDELQKLDGTIKQYQSAAPSSLSVTFDPGCLTVVDFLCCFECRVQREDKNSSASTLCVRMYSGLSEARTAKLARLLFTLSLSNGPSSDYNILLRDSHIPPENLMTLLLQLWLSDDKRPISAVINLHSIIKSISCLKEYVDLACDNGDHAKTSEWWQTMRDLFAQSTNVGSSLLGALIGRSVASDVAKLAMAEAELSGDGEADTWSSITTDQLMWTTLVRQLHDLVCLQCLLRLQPTRDDILPKPAWESETISICVKKVLDGGKGILPEVVAKWIMGQGILPSMLCLVEDEEEDEEMADEDTTSVKQIQKPTDPFTPIVGQLQEVQHHLPHSLDSDTLMANCAWEYLVLWNKDTEIIVALEQAVEYLKCIQNAVLLHGVAMMMWQMFLVKKLSSATFLMEKVGKAPKDRLCRRDVGLSEVALEKFMAVCVDLLDTITQAVEDCGEQPVFGVEEAWRAAQGPSSLAELAAEHKRASAELVQHHHTLCLSLHAILTFSMKSIKPFALFDTKGKSAFFKPLHSSVSLDKTLDEAICTTRRSFVCRVMSSAVQSLGIRQSSAGEMLSGSPPSSLARIHSPLYFKWVPAAVKLANLLGVYEEDIKLVRVAQLYDSGHDKMAEELLVTVTDHPVMGSKLLKIVGQRLHHFVLLGDPSDRVEKLSKCSTSIATWIKSMDCSDLRYVNSPIQETAALVGQAVNQLPETHAEYNLAIELVELVQAFL